MSYALSRSAIARHVLAMTLEARYVSIGSRKGKARAFHTSSQLSAPLAQVVERVDVMVQEDVRESLVGKRVERREDVEGIGVAGPSAGPSKSALSIPHQQNDEQLVDAIYRRLNRSYRPRATAREVLGLNLNSIPRLRSAEIEWYLRGTIHLSRPLAEMILYRDAELSSTAQIRKKIKQLWAYWQMYFRLLEELHYREPGSDIPLDLIDIKVFNNAIKLLCKQHFQGRPVEYPSNPGLTDKWSTLSVPLILELMATLSITPNRSNLSNMIRSAHTQIIPTGSKAQSKRSKLGINHYDLGRMANDVWPRRHEMLNSAVGVVPEVKKGWAYRNEIITTMDEAEILSLRHHDKHITDALEGMLPHWWDMQAEAVNEAREEVKHICDKWHAALKDPGDKSWKVIRAETKNDREAVLFLLRNALLPDFLAPKPSKHQYTSQPGLDDPFDLLNLLFGLQSPYHLDTEVESNDTMTQAICRLRNAFYLHHQHQHISRLIKCLIPSRITSPTSTSSSTHSDIEPQPRPRVAIPRVGSKVYETLLNSATNRTSFRDILILLSQLSPPADPAFLTRKNIHLLRYQAQASQRKLSLQDHPEFHRMPQMAQYRATEGGFEGLLEWLFERWKVFEHPRLIRKPDHSALGYADEEAKRIEEGQKGKGEIGAGNGGAGTEHGGKRIDKWRRVPLKVVRSEDITLSRSPSFSQREKANDPDFQHIPWR